jgi:hypothetical protein
MGYGGIEMVVTSLSELKENLLEVIDWLISPIALLSYVAMLYIWYFGIPLYEVIYEDEDLSLDEKIVYGLFFFFIFPFMVIFWWGGSDWNED